MLKKNKIPNSEANILETKAWPEKIWKIVSSGKIGLRDWKF